MSNFNWCHGPECHTNRTQDRVRGSKGNKVLRTRKISLSNGYIRDSIYAYFCNQGCLYEFLKQHMDRVITIAPRREPLETPIEDPKKTTHTNNYGYRWTDTEIKKIVDNA